MALTHDLLAELRCLSHAEKLRVVQLLINELAAEEEAFFTPGANYEIWSPFDAADATATLLNMLDKDVDG